MIGIDIPGHDLAEYVAGQFSELYSYMHPRSMFGLAGNTQDFPGGEFENLYFPSYVYDMPPGVEEYKPTFLVKACYTYVTRASPVVCIDPNPQSNSEKVCRPGTITLSGGQGAPVAVTRVEQVGSPSKIVFTIYVEHHGDGTVYDFNSAYKCDPEVADVIKPTDLNVVYVSNIHFSGNLDEEQSAFFSCKPASGAIRLINGKGMIHCEYTPPTDYFGSRTAYEAPLYVELYYYYGESMKKQMTIKKI